MKVLDITNIECVMGDPTTYFDLRVQMELKEYIQLVELLDQCRDNVILVPRVKK